MAFDLSLLQRQPVEVTALVIGNSMLEGSMRRVSFVPPGDSEAAREAGPCSQSPPRPRSVPAASQGLRLRLLPQPGGPRRDAAGSWRPGSRRCASARPSAAAAACSGQRQTLGSLCVTGLLPDALNLHQAALNGFPPPPQA